MPRACHSCRDRTLESRDLFCPSCGTPAVWGRFSLVSSSDDPGLRLVSCDQWDPPEPLPALDLVVSCNAHEIDRVALEAFDGLSSEGIVLPGLSAIAGSAEPMHVTLSVAHPLAGRAPNIVAEQASNQDPPNLSVLGSLPLAAFAADGDGLAAFVAIRNDGGAIEIGQFMLSLPLLEEEVPQATPSLLLKPGGIVNLRIRVSKEIFESLSANIGLARGARLQIGLVDTAMPGLLIVDETADSLKLYIRDTRGEGRPFAGAGLTGRRARVGVALHNRSPEPITISGIRISRRGGPSDIDLRIPLRWQAGIGPGEIVAAELRPYLTADLLADATDMTAGQYIFEVVVFSRPQSGTQLSAKGEFGLEVREPAPFAGRVCIDFGTTETAAAISKARLRPLRLPEFPPQVVELGCVGLSSQQASRLASAKRDVTDPVYSLRFLETSLALDRDGRWSVGEDIPGAADEESEGIQLFRQFKWFADESPTHPLDSVTAIRAAIAAEQADIEKRADPRLLLENYLREVLKLIEEHPDVAALCGDVGSGEAPGIWATRPVNMKARMHDAFVDGFRSAGMRQLRVDGDQTVGSLILESWPPLLLTIEGEEQVYAPIDLAGEGFEADAIEEDDAGAIAVILDVGGGSADISVVDLQAQTGGLRLEILHNDMSRQFAGTRFEELIASELKAHLNWKNDHLAAAPQLGQEFAQTVRWLQNSAGPMEPLKGDDMLCPAEPVDVTVIEATLRAAFDHPDRGPLVRASHWRRPGTGLIPLPFEDLPPLFAKLVHAFRVRFWPELHKKITEAAEIAKARKQRGAAEGREPRIVVTVSGRGYACPLALEMVRTILYEQLGSVEPNYLGPPASKSITSWGALRLIDIMESHVLMTLVPREEASTFSVLADLSMTAKRDKLRFVPMRLVNVGVYAQGRKRIARIIDEEGAPPEERGKQVDSFQVALVRADIPRLAELEEASIYSGGAADAEWAGEIKFLSCPRNAQWLYVMRRSGKLRMGAVRGADIDQAVQALLRVVR